MRMFLLLFLLVLMAIGIADALSVPRDSECPRGEQKIIDDCFSYTVCDRETDAECYLDDALTMLDPDHTSSAWVFVWTCGKRSAESDECRAVFNSRQ